MSVCVCVGLGRPGWYEWEYWMEFGCVVVFTSCLLRGKVLCVQCVDRKESRSVPLGVAASNWLVGLPSGERVWNCKLAPTDPPVLKISNISSLRDFSSSEIRMADCT